MNNELNQSQIELVENIYKQKVIGIKNDFITKRIKREGLYEKPTVEFILNILSKINNPVVMDVGANIGNHSLAFSRVAQIIYSFEPVPTIYNLLKTNVENNNIKNIHTFNYGLSDTDHTANVMIVDGNIGMSHITDTNDHSHPTINLVNGDNFIYKNNINKLDFIKVDVGGHEFFVIKGLRKTIDTFRPIILMEWNNEANFKSFSNDFSLNSIFPNCTIYSAGRNTDKLKWKNKLLGNLRRKTFKLINPRKVQLYKFPEEKRDNILIVPNEKSDLLS